MKSVLTRRSPLTGLRPHRPGHPIRCAAQQTDPPRTLLSWHLKPSCRNVSECLHAGNGDADRPSCDAETSGRDTRPRPSTKSQPSQCRKPFSKLSKPIRGAMPQRFTDFARGTLFFSILETAPCESEQPRRRAGPNQMRSRCMQIVLLPDAARPGCDAQDAPLALHICPCIQLCEQSTDPSSCLALIHFRPMAEPEFRCQTRLNAPAQRHQTSRPGGFHDLRFTLAPNLEAFLGQAYAIRHAVKSLIGRSHGAGAAFA